MIEAYDTFDKTLDFIHLLKNGINPKSLKYYHEIIEMLVLSGKDNSLKRKLKLVLFANQFRQIILQKLRPLIGTFLQATK